MIVANGDEGDHSYEDKNSVGDGKDKMTADDRNDSDPLNY